MLKRCLAHIWLILLAFPFGGYGQPLTDTPVSLPQPTAPDTLVKPAHKHPAGDEILNYAFSFMGDRYRRGGTGGRGFDCSGYTMMVFRHFGIKLPHTSAGQSFMGVEVPLKLARKGDLIFFRGRNVRRRGIGHVGIIISNRGEPVRFVHSATSQGVRIDRLDAPYYKRRYMKVTRVLPLN